MVCNLLNMKKQLSLMCLFLFLLYFIEVILPEKCFQKCVVGKKDIKGDGHIGEFSIDGGSNLLLTIPLDLNLTLENWNLKLNKINEVKQDKCSKMDQVKFVGNSL